MNRIHRLIAIPALLLASQAFAEQNPPPNPNLPKIEAPAAPVVDWPQMLKDFQGGDAAKQEAAAKVFFDSGSRGHSELAALLKHENKAIAKRAGELRDKIEQRSQEIYRQAMDLHNKIQMEPLSAENYKKLGDSWLAAAGYVTKSDFKQVCFQQVLESKKAAQRLEQNLKQLAQLDDMIKALKPEQAVERSAHLLSRAEMLNTLRRFPDAIKDTEAVAAADNTKRFTPQALKLQATLRLQLQDTEKGFADCRRILQEFPRSTEVKAAHQLLIENLQAIPKLDEAIAQVKLFAEAFPLDEDAQSAVDGMLASLAEEHDFARIASFTDWMQNTLPPSRLSADVFKYGGAAHEFVLKDYARAAQAYETLRDKYSDQIDAVHLIAALKRLKAKQDGVFPKEPVETDAGPAGALAKFLKSVRTRSVAGIKTLVPKADAEKFSQILEISGGEFVTNTIVASYIVKEVKAAEGANEAQLILDYYNFDADQPEPVTQRAVKEDGVWKISWTIDGDAE
jgi:tetratricopeptide (TPR) repeat protein